MIKGQLTGIKKATQAFAAVVQSSVKSIVNRASKIKPEDLTREQKTLLRAMGKMTNERL
jgi:hypothetical protein